MDWRVILGPSSTCNFGLWFVRFAKLFLVSGVVFRLGSSILGPLTPWTAEASALMHYYHDPGDSYSIRVKERWRITSQPTIRLRASKRGVEGLSINSLRFPLFRLPPPINGADDLGTVSTGYGDTPLSQFLAQHGVAGDQ